MGSDGAICLMILRPDREGCIRSVELHEPRCQFLVPPCIISTSVGRTSMALKCGSDVNMGLACIVMLMDSLWYEPEVA